MTEQPQIVYLNGQYLPKDQAHIDIEDRGMLFADGVYEVVGYFNGKSLAMAEHLERLNKSLDIINLTPPDDAARFDEISDELIKRNNLKNADVYWQITRGPAPRSHVMPENPNPTILAITYPIEPFNHDRPIESGHAILVEDIRWHLCNAKTLMLLPNSLAKTAAKQAGAIEAILHRGDIVTEGTSTALLIVKDGELLTHPADNFILPSITRAEVIDLARRLGITVKEKTFTVDELLNADEVMIAGTTTYIAAITEVDDMSINGGGIGPVTQRLYDAFVEDLQKFCNID